jgi:methionine sulfoxide reductase catalytic subunit
MSKKSFETVPIQPSEITPEHVYLSRRDFLKTMGVTSAFALLLAACGGKPPQATDTPAVTPAATSAATRIPGTSGAPSSGSTDELGASLTPFDSITHYNNYYEFSTDKSAVAGLVDKFQASPWEVQVDGLVNNPKTFGLEDLLKQFDQEERIYRLRCVEAWSMVIPWTGFQLADLLKEVDPQSSAKYVRFETVNRPDQMPGMKDPLYPWPYNEGLRLDEAMNNLTILATGLYGKPLPVQDGAPIRVVVPWKYGFKSIKSIVKIELTDKQPDTMWNTIAPNEYGFYSNVNPEVDHPRWSQGTERRIGESSRRKTLMFNGYADQVASLYTGMDLRINY